MKIVNYILTNILIVLLLSIGLAFFLDFEYAFISIILLFLVSFVLIIISGKWIKLFISFLIYVVFFVLWLTIIFFKGMTEELSRTDIGDFSFYSNEIKANTNFILSDKWTLLSEIDTIHYMGIEGEYNATCLLKTNKNELSRFKLMLDKNNKFKKIDWIVEDDNKILNKFKLKSKDFDLAYEKHDEGSLRLLIAIDMDKKLVYYDGFYY